MLQDGYLSLPAGRLAAAVTYLRRDLLLPVAPPQWPDGVTLVRFSRDDLVAYRQLFRAVGQEWLWFSRLLRSDQELAVIIGDPQVHALCLMQNGQRIGLVELDFRDRQQADLAYFGLVPGVIGAGFGRAMMAEALTRAREAGFSSISVNTCTLDHPRALEFYMKSGFAPQKRAVEIFPDPRVIGLLPRDVAKHIPVID